VPFYQLYHPIHSLSEKNSSSLNFKPFETIFKMTTKEIKVQISSRNDVIQQSGLLRQANMNKNNCLCSPTTHAGSFRCRLHRTPSLIRTKSMESSSSTHGSVVDANGDANKD